MTTYLLYRHGANGANQGLSNKRPVAIVDAPNQTAACETARNDGLSGKLDPYAPSWPVLAPTVTVWANQRLSAVPLSRAPRGDVRVVEEEAMVRGV